MNSPKESKLDIKVDKDFSHTMLSAGAVVPINFSPRNLNRRFESPDMPVIHENEQDGKSL